MGAPTVHPTAVVGPEVELADDVVVGPHCVLDGPVRIGAGTTLASHVSILGDTVLGERNRVFCGAAIGAVPQDLKFDADAPTGVRIGHGNDLREHVTIHRATAPGTHTTIGDGNMFMVGSHAAHDCVVGDHNILANNVLLAGHVRLESRIVIAGGVPIHQFCRIGELVMIGGLTAVSRDVPPFCAVHGRSYITGLNKVGIRRAPDIAPEAARELQQAFKAIFRDGRDRDEALDALEAGGPCDEVARMIAFLRVRSKRGLCRPGRLHAGQVLNFGE